MIGTVGIVALLGNFYGAPHLSAWGASTPMAPSTAFCFIAASAGLWTLGSAIERIDKVMSRAPCAQGPTELFDHGEIIRRLNLIESHLETLRVVKTGAVKLCKPS